MRTYYWVEIVVAATKHKLDPILVEAVVVRESGGNADAFRFEKEFWNRLMKGKPEFKGLNPRRYSSSYGLMQPMWAVAVERGFPRDLDPEHLFIPTNSLEFGCRQLRHLTDLMATKFPTVPLSDQRLAILASYNGGFQGPTALRPRNKEYALGVMANYKTLVSEHAA